MTVESQIYRCRTCKRELAGRDRERALKHRVYICTACYREYKRNYEAKKKKEMPWYDDFIYKDSKPIVVRKEKGEEGDY